MKFKNLVLALIALSILPSLAHAHFSLMHYVDFWSQYPFAILAVVFFFVYAAWMLTPFLVKALSKLKNKK